MSYSMRAWSPFLLTAGILLFATSSSEAQMAGRGMAGRMMMGQGVMRGMQSPFFPMMNSFSSRGSQPYSSASSYGQSGSGYGGSGSQSSGYGGSQSPTTGYDGPSELTSHELPHPTGSVRTAPADAAVIKINLPDEFASVWFDGRAVTSVGKARSYVTPYLQKGVEVQYDIKMQWMEDGTRVTQERRIIVQAGKITEVRTTKS